MTENPPEVVIAGGGIAALELVLALRELAGDRVRITLVAPEPDFVLRPMLVAEPLGAGAAQRRPLSEIAADVGFRLVPAAVASVDPRAPPRRAAQRRHAALRHARPRPGRPHDRAVRRRHRARRRRRRRAWRRCATRSPGARAQRRVRRADARRLAAAALRGRAAHRAHERCVRVSLITPEQRPLELFGAEASTTVERVLAAAGIEFIGGARPRADGTVVLRARADRRRPHRRAAAGARPAHPRGPGERPVRADRRSTRTGASTASRASTPPATPPTSRSSRAARLPAGRRGRRAHRGALRRRRHAVAVPAGPARDAADRRRRPVALGAGPGGEPSKFPGRYLAPYLVSRHRAPANSSSEGVTRSARRRRSFVVAGSLRHGFRARSTMPDPRDR